MAQPDIILIFTDNQQASTLACYGNSEVHTPNLDAMARDGIRFDKAFCTNSFCSPCRASTLTGLMPSQHGVHSWIDDRNMQEWPSGWHALEGLTTLPERLKALGYRTGIFGKYHLGDPKTPAPEWDSWVTMADGHVRSFYDNDIFDKGKTYKQPGHSVDFFTDKALDFLTESDQPAFAYIPLPAPYGHWPATNDGNRNRHAARYDDCPMNSIPRVGIRKEAIAHYDKVKAGSGKGLDFSLVLGAPNDLPTLRNYYSQITMIDDAVGRIREAAPDALIVFTTDHGMSMGHHGFWGHGASTYPSNLHFAAHSIPMIIEHRGSIAAGQTSDRHVTNMDLFSTLLDYVGADPEPDVPSRSFAALLRGGDLADWENAVYAEQEETRVIRTSQWVYFKRYSALNAPPLPDALFNVLDDPDEMTNLADDSAFSDVVSDLSQRITQYFERYSRDNSDMWRGGQPIQNSMLKAYWKGIWGEDWQPVYSYRSP
jgi:arylsulfatase A-like enzyme